MPTKIIRFSKKADEWFERHRWVRPSKIKSIVLHKNGELIKQPDGCYMLVTGVTNNTGSPVKLYIKYRVTDEGHWSDVLVIGLHTGKMSRKIKDF